MIVLGINENHNATAAILKDGEVIYAASEERITRLKNDVGYPWQTIEEGLRQAGLAGRDIDYVAYTTASPQNPLEFKIKRITTFKIADYVREMREHWKPLLIENKTSSFWDTILREPRFQNLKNQYYGFSFLDATSKEQWGEAFNRERVRVTMEQLGIAPEKIIFQNHHYCHASFAYYASPIDKTKPAAVVTADGWGDGENATIWLAKDGVLQKVHGTALCNLARIYRYMTLLLGMKPFEHEYKVMGLAPYAKDYVMEPAYKVFKDTLVVDGTDFKWHNKPSDLYFYFRDKLEGMRFDGIAAGLQKWTDELVVEWMTNILEHLDVDSLAYSGGLSMNVKTNQAITGIPRLKHFFVPPSGGDESTAIGAAYSICAEHGIEPKPLAHGYLGYELPDTEIKALLEKYQIKNSYTVIANASTEEILDLLVNNKIIARCVGKMEFGARALGNRSILCNPSCYDNIRLINEKIKFRDFWMPFTPSILDYRANDYLVNPKGIGAPYMTIAFPTTPLAREHLAAAIHPADFTARPQIVEKTANPEYYELIQAFEKKTGIGALLNTSLNLHGESIVRNAEDAWHTFTNSGLDALLLNKTLIVKS